MDQQAQMQNQQGLAQPQQQQPPQQHQAARSIRRRAHVRIIEQPASKALRFRYECEGRSAGSIPGVNSTSENKTYPTIEIADYVGRAVVVVSCVTKDPPYRPHPHNLVGREGCKKGVCTVEINSETMRAVFSNLGIQCVKKKDIESALRAREEIRVDPFKTGFDHRFQPASIDLNSVRLCFQVFLESDVKGRFTTPLTPVVSDPVYDKKAMSDLVICKLCKCSSTVAGGKEIILLCEKVAKEDIAVRFFEEKDGQTVWEAYGEFQHTDVHKQTAINFRTPRYRTLDIEQPVKVFIQLKRPSDGATSEPIPFDYLPLDSDPSVLKRKRQKFGGEASSHLFKHFQEQQKLQEPHQAQDGRQHLGFLNIAQTTAIKAEPRDTSPLPYTMFGNTTAYRMPENSPSPQPLSPSNPMYNLSNTPSPYNMAGGNMISPTNQQYTGAGAAGGLSPNMNMDMNEMGAAGAYQQHYQPQQNAAIDNYSQMAPQMTQQQHHWNLPPSTSAAVMSNLLTTNSTLAGSQTQQQWNLPAGIKQEQLTTVNHLASNPFMMSVGGNSTIGGQHQQNNTTSNMNISDAPNISSLLDMDSEQLIHFNSAELSNLSLS
ncbi:embryonic polarity protein dorsal-like isoform X2 [Hermetia illucens]|uniref:embryonic polarity protein dorsal-like isoform X2 n=2 Tax=Hermetia illucens TaxID=343691 RepID=UPI0018CC088B|nr:embryonic polarity protein dorsal-like isoform X2 [Hermetia illucens]XP_037926500.1 embryonic polarity protein dorsal-like isoform X2 [Hermetia illucens]XP_037926501.1 embryonic polarity protein dorsal-like isoform X2 [Hermetia illucens]XP_037926502.1 embryonic polarity protein dorsal-like isoform X2 [Hermetia illucens]XP_037926503.1 embryonic polarity protein dorsal-like isoform X2 [Hermetia illucens]XP_037926504.1 embryonic polarity protein dorsal-like isoform X2 [Hermetia illucens]XP_03